MRMTSKCIRRINIEIIKSTSTPENVEPTNPPKETKSGSKKPKSGSKTKSSSKKTKSSSKN